MIEANWMKLYKTVITMAIILLVLLAVSLLFNFGSLLSGIGAHGRVRYSRSVGPKLEEVVAEDHLARDPVQIEPSRTPCQGGTPSSSILGPQASPR